MKLISEEINNAEYIVEEKDNGKKDYKIRGIFLQSDIKKQKWKSISKRCTNERSKKI